MHLLLLNVPATEQYINTQWNVISSSELFHFLLFLTVGSLCHGAAAICYNMLIVTEIVMWSVRDGLPSFQVHIYEYPY